MATTVRALVCLASVLVVLCDLTWAAPAEDLITNLPHLTFTPSFKQYSGYLQALDGKRLHYWFTESENHPPTDPVAVWMNGGPGCSSLFGLLGENGPLRVTNERTLVKNEFSWTKVANMLYLEAPAGVGFSYSKSKNYTTDDDDTARNNFQALKDFFFKKFPEYKKNDFYITGESYAGVYIPTLVSLIIDEPIFNLKGFMIGNSLSSDPLNSNSVLYFIAYHGLISTQTFTNLLEACCPGKDTSNCSFVDGTSDKCKTMISLANGGTDNLDPYNIYARQHADDMRSCDPMLKLVKQRALMGKRNGPIKVQTCNRKLGDRFETYLNLPEVRKALHIPPEVQYWIQCAGIVYRWQYSDMYAQYHKAMPTKLRILLYNGDVDSVCNFLGDEWFVDVLHPHDKPQYKQWFYHPANDTREVGGIYKSYERFTFVTVRGSGHMVPQDRPLPALTMFKKYLANQFD